MSINTLSVKKIISSCLDDKDLRLYISELPEDIIIEISSSAGELKDKLSQLTSYYAFYSSLFSDAEFVCSLIKEIIEEFGSRLRYDGKTAYKTRTTKGEKDDKIKFKAEVSLDCYGIIFKGRTIQYFRNLSLRTHYFRDIVKSRLSTVDKSISVGNTMLSYEKVELRNLGIV